jgi:hypothetical protein
MKMRLIRPLAKCRCLSFSKRKQMRTKCCCFLTAFSLSYPNVTCISLQPQPRPLPSSCPFQTTQMRIRKGKKKKRRRNPRNPRIKNCTRISSQHFALNISNRNEDLNFSHRARAISTVNEIGTGHSPSEHSYVDGTIAWFALHLTEVI